MYHRFRWETFQRPSPGWVEAHGPPGGRRLRHIICQACPFRVCVLAWRVDGHSAFLRAKKGGLPNGDMALVGAPLRVSPAPAVVRPPACSPATRPRVPEGFFSAEAQALLVGMLTQRAAFWQRQSDPPIYFYGCQSTLLWGAEAARRWERRSLRRAKRWTLCEELSVDLERGLRLLTLERTAEGHTLGEWREALAGVLWRVGQIYRELARHEGEAGAQTTLLLAIDALWR